MGIIALICLFQVFHLLYILQLSVKHILFSFWNMSSALYNTSSTHMFLTSWKALQVKIIITWSWFRTFSHWESVGFCERNYSRVPAASWETRHASFKWSASVALRKLCRAAEHGVLSISSYHLGLWAVNLNSTVCCVEKNEMVDCVEWDHSGSPNWTISVCVQTLGIRSL